MTLLALLDRLAELDVRLWADGERLRLRAPVGALTGELRSALEAHKPELLERLRATDPEAHGIAVRLVPIARGGRLPLSFAQQRLWFLTQLEPDSAAYNIPAAIRIGGILDVRTLARASEAIVQRHEVLRTTFTGDAGEPVPVVHPSMPIPLTVVDLTAVPEADRPAAIRAQAAAHMRGLFDLSRGPLLRLALLRLNAGDHILFFTIHHLASDGWSSRVFMRELALLYDAFSHGRPSPLADLPIQYVDFAAWQQQWLHGPVLDRQLAYWRSHLRGLPTLPLPTDRPRPPRQTMDGASVQFTLPTAIGEEVKRLARAEGATLFQLLLAGFAATISLVTGSQDVPIGSPVANRNRRELESLIGFFVNPIVLRVDLSGRPTFRELLARVRTLALGGYAHQDLPFEQLVAELRPDRDLSRHPLFQVVFVLQDNPVERQQIEGLTLRQLDTDSWHVKFDLVVNMWDSQQGLVAWWEYNLALFDRGTIELLHERYVRLLAAITAAPDAHVDELEILSPEELTALYDQSRLTALDRELDFDALAASR